MPGLRWLLLCVLLAASAAAAAAVPEIPRFRVLGPADGLPATTVTALARDRDGFVWAATWDGLARYDGVGFRVWRHDPDDPASLPGNVLQTLHVDSRNRIWVASEGGGVSVMDADRKGFRHFRKAQHPQMESDEVFAIAGRGDDEIWLGTYGGGLYSIDAQDQVRRLRASDADVNAVLDRAILSLAFYGGDGILVGTLQGLVRCSEKHVARMQLPGEQPWPAVVSMWREGTSTWIGSTRGLHLLDDDGRWRTPAWAAAFTGKQTVTAMTGDGEGGYWIATTEGLWRVRGGEAPVAVMHDAKALGINSQVQALLRQDDGALWVSLPSRGLGYLRSDWRRTAVLDESHGLRGGLYRGVAPASHGGVWLVGSSGEVEWLDTAQGTVEAQLPQPLRMRPNAVLEDRRGGLWVDQVAALVRVERAVVAGAPRTRVFEAPQATVDPIMWLLPAPDGDFWVASASGALHRRDVDGNLLDAVPAQTPGLGLTGVSTVALAPDATPWVAAEAGLRRWNAGTRSFETPPGLDPQPVLAFAFDGPERLWLQRLTGLESWQREGGRWRLRLHLGIGEGIPATEATGLVVDRQHRAWLATRRGLFRIAADHDAGSASVRRFGVREGLPSQEFTERALALDADGVLVAGTGDGSLLLLDTVMADPVRPPPNFVVDALRVRRGEALVDLPLQGGFELRPDDHDLSVVTRLMAFDDPESNRYRFRLRGFDQDWVVAQGRGERVFSQLPPGDYVLELQAAAGPDQPWSPLHGIAFRVPPPWWRSAWGIAMLAGVLVLGLLSLARLYRQRLRRRSEWQLDVHKRELAEQASLAKSRFLATLGHEVRTPMTGVLGMSELLLSTPLDTRQRGYIESIRRAGEHLMRLVNDALDLARIEAGKLELEAQDFDLRALVAEVAALMAPGAEQRGLRFQASVAEDAPRGLRGDPVRVRQILLNLIGNAIKFTDRGEVALDVQAAPGGGVGFTVRDTGPGLNAEQKQRLFRRFEQADGARTSARYGGSGLGLAICQELAMAMGGQIGVDSEPGQGAAFHVRLPLPAATPAPPPPRPVHSTARHLDLLLVEDDPTVAEVIASLLRAQGHRVAHAAHGLAALADVSVARFDLALLDLDLPGMDGLALARQLRLQGFAQPLLAVTARADADAEQQARAAGFDGFLRKPVTGEILAAAIESVLPGEAP